MNAKSWKVVLHTHTAIVCNRAILYGIVTISQQRNPIAENFLIVQHSATLKRLTGQGKEPISRLTDRAILWQSVAHRCALQISWIDMNRSVVQYTQCILIHISYNLITLLIHSHTYGVDFHGFEQASWYLCFIVLDTPRTGTFTGQLHWGWRIKLSLD